jgi:hypothetical protein
MVLFATRESRSSMSAYEVKAVVRADIPGPTLLTLAVL